MVKHSLHRFLHSTLTYLLDVSKFPEIRALLRTKGAHKERARGPVLLPYEVKSRNIEQKLNKKSKFRAHPKKGSNPRNFSLFGRGYLGAIAAFRPVPLPFKNYVCAPAPDY